MHSSPQTGMVADIQRFCVHDGFGIRTGVFLKGCNMRCAWCHNPETIAFAPQVLLDTERCIGCGQCADGCYTGARRIVGQEMSVQAVLSEVLMDRAYYGSDGGMTLTGGEPCCQDAFARALLLSAREAGIHCALETNLSLPEQTLREVLPLCDLILCDLKMWDSQAHAHWTGVGNERVLRNLLYADTLALPLVVRTPLIQGINDTPEEITAIARYASRLKHLLTYELLPYHALGTAKSIEDGPAQQRFEPPTKERTLELAMLARQFVPVRLAGVAL